MHRDLSSQNIMYYTVGNHYYGILNDYDLAIINPSDPTTRRPTSLHRTGTAPFMSMDLLAGTSTDETSVVHTYAHEMESFFYVFLFLMLGYTNHCPVGNPLKLWLDKSWETVYQQKVLFYAMGNEASSHYRKIIKKVSCLCIDKISPPLSGAF